MTVIGLYFVGMKNEIKCWEWLFGNCCAFWKRLSMDLGLYFSIFRFYRLSLVILNLMMKTSLNQYFDLLFFTINLLRNFPAILKLSLVRLVINPNDLLEDLLDFFFR